MPMSKDQLLSEALALGPADREALAHEILLSLPDDEGDVIDAAWLQEYRRRVAAVDSGTMQTTPGEQVMRRLRNRLGQ